MKQILMITLLALTSNVFAMTPAVYCKEAGKIQNITNQKNSCHAQILKGSICFVGDRNEVIEILNSSLVKNKFMDSAEYIGEASAYKKKSITYFSYGDATDPSFMRKIDHCPKNFSVE